MSFHVSRIAVRHCVYSIRFVASKPPAKFRYRPRLFSQAPADIQAELKNYGWFLSGLENAFYRAFPQIMNQPMNVLKQMLDSLFFFLRGLSRMQPFRQKTFLQDLLGVAKLLGCLSLLPLLNYLLFGKIKGEERLWKLVTLTNIDFFPKSIQGKFHANKRFLIDKNIFIDFRALICKIVVLTPKID